MTLDRRAFLTGAATAPLLARAARAGDGGDVVTLNAAPATLQIAPADFPKTEVWAYNGQVPGQLLRYRQGERLRVRLDNALDQPTTIHWHGLRLPNAMDGVPGMTQAAVPTGATFGYDFALRDAGTFWYHPHEKSAEQVSRGLAGVLVVDEPADAAPDVDADEVIVLDDWRMTQEAQIHASFGNRHDMSHAGRLGNYVTANARQDLSLEARPGARLRLRLVNTATARVFALRFSGLRVWTAALDGMPLEHPAETTEITIAPAQRADLLVDVTATDGEDAVVGSVERDGTFALVSFRVAGTRVAPRPAPGALPGNDLPRIALADARRVPLTMKGGAMRGLPEGAVWNGTRMDMRQLAEAGQFWSFNDTVGMTDEPFVSAALGETVRVPITNRTAFAHAMHLHGMHFREVLPGGGMGPWRDTLLVRPDETREIVFVAENPGDWMFHCHMLSHQMSGMMNWVKIA